MLFEWDEEKNRINLAKHKINFEIARDVFSDPLARFILERVVNGEERWQAIGEVGSRFLVVVVHCYRTRGGEEIIRIISARAASARERKLYEEK